MPMGRGGDDAEYHLPPTLRRVKMGVIVHLIGEVGHIGDEAVDESFHLAALVQQPETVRVDGHTPGDALPGRTLSGRVGRSFDVGQCVHISGQCMTDAHALPSSGFGGGSHFKVDLAQVDVGADDGNHHLVAEAPGLAGSGVGQADALGQAGAGGSQAGSRHEALHAVVQLDEEAALGHAGDGTLVALAQMAAFLSPPDLPADR